MPLMWDKAESRFAEIFTSVNNFTLSRATNPYYSASINSAGLSERRGLTT
jgi:hypothetical protein